MSLNMCKYDPNILNQDGYSQGPQIFTMGPFRLLCQQLNNKEFNLK
jgi:hypothetical protein